MDYTQEGTDLDWDQTEAMDRTENAHEEPSATATHTLTHTPSPAIYALLIQVKAGETWLETVSEALPVAYSFRHIQYTFLRYASKPLFGKVFSPLSMVKRVTGLGRRCYRTRHSGATLLLRKSLLDGEEGQVLRNS